MWEKDKSGERGFPLAVAFLVIVPTVLHLTYSWMGFSPTDDGFTLAYSRRLVDGEIPHRDFIIIRPFLSPLIHTPFILFGGEYTYWLSRWFVWFQFAVISWAWVAIINRAFGNPFGSAMKVFVALISLSASVHHFVFTAWHTIDGLFLASIGAWLLVARGTTKSKTAGYTLVGAAYLCKQSFIFTAPLFLILLGDWRRPRYWLAAAAPGLLYCAFLLATGSFPDAFAQLTSQTGIVSVGVFSFINAAPALGFVAGAGSAVLVLAGHRLPLGGARLPQSAGALALVGLPGAFLTYGMVTDQLSTVSYGIFGILLGTAAILLAAMILRLGPERQPEAARVALLILVLAWSGSLSFGANYPGLMMGPMFVALAAFVYSRRESLTPPFAPRLVPAALLVAGLAVVVSFGWSKTQYPYRDAPVGELTEPVGEVLPGGRLIYTNPTTYDFLEDLQQAREIARSEDKRYAVIPQVAGYWMQSEQPNPLPIDWPWGIELGTPELNARVKNELDARRGEVAVIAQKTDAFTLSGKLQPATSDRYEILDHVRENYRKTGETEYFEIYE